MARHAAAIRGVSAPSPARQQEGYRALGHSIPEAHTTSTSRGMQATLDDRATPLFTFTNLAYSVAADGSITAIGTNHGTPVAGQGTALMGALLFESDVLYGGRKKGTSTPSIPRPVLPQTSRHFRAPTPGKRFTALRRTLRPPPRRPSRVRLRSSF
jgi:hypothetical protein